METIYKPAYNEEFRTMQFRRPDGQGQLNAEETLSTVALVCIDKATGEDTSSVMLSDVAIYDQTQVTYKLKGGEVGKYYWLKFRVTSSNNQKLEETAVLRIT